MSVKSSSVTGGSSRSATTLARTLEERLRLRLLRPERVDDGEEQRVLCLVVLRQFAVGNEQRVLLLATVLDRSQRPAVLLLEPHPRGVALLRRHDRAVEDVHHALDD